MAIFSTRPSYSWSPSRRKYVRDCGLDTTAIMPLGARTTPSRRSVLTCKPAFPAGMGPVDLLPLCSRPTMDSNGSRRAILVSEGTGLGVVEAEAGFLGAAFFATRFLGADCAAPFEAVFAGVFAAGDAGFDAPGLAGWGAGFAA